MNATTDSAHKMITEEIPVAGHELLARVKGLLEEGRVRHIKVKSQTGQTYFELPLAVGLLGGAALAWASPFLAMAGALTGLVSSVKLEVVRDSDAPGAIEAAKGMVSEAKDAATHAVAATKRSVQRVAKRATASAKRVVGKAPIRAAAKTAKRAAAKAPARAAKTAKTAVRGAVRGAKPAARRPAKGR